MTVCNQQSSHLGGWSQCIIHAASSLVCSYQIIVGEKLIRNAWEITTFSSVLQHLSEKRLLQERHHESTGILKALLTIKYRKCRYHGIKRLTVERQKQERCLLIRDLVTYSNKHNTGLRLFLLLIVFLKAASVQVQYWKEKNHEKKICCLCVLHVSNKPI